MRIRNVDFDEHIKILEELDGHAPDAVKQIRAQPREELDKIIAEITAKSK